MNPAADSVRDSARWLVFGMAIAGLVWGRDVLMPLALAMMLAFILVPLVRAATARRVPRGLAVSVVMLGLLASVVGGSLVLSAQMLSFTAQLGTYKANLVEKVRSFSLSGSPESVVKRAIDTVEVLEREIKRAWSSPRPEGGDKVVVVARNSETESIWTNVHLIGAPLAQAALALLFTAFLLLQHNDLRDRVVRVIGTDNLSELAAAMSDAGERLSQLFLAQAALNLGFGVFIALALWLLGVPNPFLWGVFAGILRFIPFVGAILAAIPPLVMAAAVDPGWAVFVSVLLMFVIGETLMSNVIEPLMLGKRAGLSPFSMVAAASFWTVIWGPVGLLLAAPITMAVVVLGRYVPGLEFLSVLLGDEPPLSPEHEFYHRLLSGDAIAAAALVEVNLKGASIVETADAVILPSLMLASADFRRGRLEAHQVEVLSDAMRELGELLADELRPGSQPRKRTFNLLIVPASGPIDAAGGQFMGDLVELKTDCTACRLDHGAGLTALSNAATKFKGSVIDGVLVLTIGGIDQQHLRFVVRRANRDFPSARVFVLDWGRKSLPESTRELTACGSAVELFSCLDCLPASGNKERNSKSKSSIAGVAEATPSDRPLA